MRQALLRGRQSSFWYALAVGEVRYCRGLGPCSEHGSQGVDSGTLIRPSVSANEAHSNHATVDCRTSPRVRGGVWTGNGYNVCPPGWVVWDVPPPFRAARGGGTQGGAALCPGL